MAYLALDPVLVRDDGLVLRRADGGETPIQGLSVLAPGWRATALFCGFDSVWLLELEHEDGREGTLFLSPDAGLLTHEIERLPYAILAEIAATIAHWKAHPHAPETRDAVAAFKQLNCRTRVQIPLSGFLPEILFDPVVAAKPDAVLRRRDGSAFRIISERPQPAAVMEWTGRFLFTLFAPLLLLEISREFDLPETWFLHEDGTFYGTSFDDVPPSLLELVSERGGRLMRRIDAGVGCFDSVRLLNGRTREAIAALVPRTDAGQHLDALQSGLAYGAADHAFDIIKVISPATQPETFARRAPGWFIDAAGNAWIVTGSLPIAIEVPYSANLFHLVMDIGKVRDGTRMTVRANDSPVSNHLLSRLQDNGTVLTCLIPPERIRDHTLRLGFSFEPPLIGAEAAFRLDRLTLSASARREELAVPPDRDLLGEFVSIGANCELGFAQRHFGIESIGLLRFSGNRGLGSLIKLFETEFAGLGAPGSLRSTISWIEGQKEYMIWADEVGLFYHTWRNPDEVSQADVIAENEIKLAYLGRKLIEDLEDGEKIFVYKQSSRADLAEMLSLHAAMSRYGRTRLLWVGRVEAGRSPGDVEWIAPNLLRGAMASFDRAEEPCIDAWLTLCRNAYREFHAPYRRQQAPHEKPPAEPPAKPARTSFEILADPGIVTPELVGNIVEAREEGLFARLRARVLARVQ